MAYTVQSSPLAKLTAKGMVNLTFPLEDQSTYHTHHIKFTVYETKRDARNSSDKTKPIATITLPMTQELQVSYNAGYAEREIGAIGSLISSSLDDLAAASEGKSPSEFVETVTKSITNMSTKDFQAAGGGAVAVVASAGVQALQQLPGTIAQGAAVGVQAFGIARNPHKATLFEGTDFRSHSFSFRFSPVRSSESDAIRNIIHLFKYHMHPAYAGAGSAFGTGNHFFSTPEFFKIELSNEGKYTVSDYQICVLKGMTVNYQPSNYPAYARVDGSKPAPMEVIMNLEFQETAIITKEVLGDPYISTDQMKRDTLGAGD